MNRKMIRLLGSSGLQNSPILDSLYREHRGGVLQFITIRSNSLDIDPEDVLHEVFMKVASRVDGKREGDVKSTFNRSYLLSMANNLIVDLYRKQLVRNKYAEYERVGDRSVSLFESPVEDGVSAQMDLELLKGELSKMRPEWRTAFLLFRVRDLSYRGVAQVMGVSPKQAEYYVKKAWEKVKSRLQFSDRSEV